MLGAGSLSVVFGASSVLGAGDVAADVDSEMRFYAVWYVVAGAFLLRATRRIESKAWAIRLIAAGFFVAGVQPHPVVGRPRSPSPVPADPHGDRADTAPGCDPVAGFGYSASDVTRGMKTLVCALSELGRYSM
jgi:hypothetical protein